jgi:2-methylcitrate dehydratase
MVCDPLFSDSVASFERVIQQSIPSRNDRPDRDHNKAGVPAVTDAEKLAAFVTRTTYDDLDDPVRLQLKMRILDALGCAFGALDSSLASQLQIHTQKLDSHGPCTLIGGGQSAPDRVAFYNSALVRYLDFNDSYLAPNETCHPSDNLGAVLAACEYANRSGRDLLTSLAIAYQVQCRLSDVAPVRDKGFDHTTQGSYAVAAGVSKALGLDQSRTAQALAICGTAFNALRVTRTGSLSNWKGLAYANTAFGCTHAVLLAMRGITGPLEVFEGTKGFMDAIAGHFEIDWRRERLDRVPQTILKKYNAEVHSQSSIEAAVDLKQRYRLSGHEVERAEVEIFDVAWHIIGGGAEGGKRNVRTKEQADHSLPYLVAVALLDGNVMPAQFVPERIERQDVQDLLRRIDVKPREEFSRLFPQALPCRVTLRLRDGRTVSAEKSDYQGFTTKPADWEMVIAKFHALSKARVPISRRERVIDATRNLERLEIRDFTGRLGSVATTDGEERGMSYGR